MNKNVVYITVAVVLVAVLGLGFAFKHQIKTALMGQPTPAPVIQTTIPAPQPAVAAKVEVDYTNAGFSPQTVTVKKGTTVVFINKSDSKMDVASNPHPTHTDYPGFDQYKSSQKGQNEYDFTFDKVGTWGFHNHLNPSDGGTVIVTE